MTSVDNARAAIINTVKFDIFTDTQAAVRTHTNSLEALNLHDAIGQ